MIKPIELVIFDCDGVLVDSERIAVRVQVALGAALGWPLTPEEVIARFIGRSHADIRVQVAARVGEETAAIWSKQFEELHREAVDSELAPVEGMAEALDVITLPTCVASSGSHEKMRHTLGRTGLYERFAGRIFSATEVARGKPAPDLFLHAARRMGIDPAACAVVEDSRPGIAHGDKGYDSNANREELRKRGILPVISRQGAPNIKGSGRLRSVVEQTFALFHGFKRLAVRWERRTELHDAFVSLACSLICWRRLKRGRS